MCVATEDDDDNRWEYSADIQQVDDCSDREDDELSDKSVCKKEKEEGDSPLADVIHHTTGYHHLTVHDNVVTVCPVGCSESLACLKTCSV